MRRGRPKSFAEERGRLELNEFMKSPKFRQMIKPALLSDLGAGIVAVPVPYSKEPTVGIRVGGELLAFRESDPIENIVHRIKAQAGVIPK